MEPTFLMLQIASSTSILSLTKINFLQHYIHLSQTNKTYFLEFYIFSLTQEHFYLPGRSLFSSRLEYSNKWLPVGRGDPLKNDPTYDYSPPEIDHRIHYWDEKSTKTNGNKNEILLLGVSSRRQYNNNFDLRTADVSFYDFFSFNIVTIFLGTDIDCYAPSTHSAHTKSQFQN